MALTDNLVSYWKLDETSTGAGAVSRDDAHSTNDLSDTNTVASATGKINNGASFVKANTEYLSIADASQTGLDLGVSGADFSMSCWLNVTTTPTQWFYTGADTRSLISKYVTTSNQRSFYLEYGYDATNYVFASHTSSNGVALTSNKVTCGLLTTGTWYHVVAIYDASAGTVEWYLNNSSLGTTGATTSIYNSTAAFQVGALSQQGVYTDAVIDELGIWSRTLTSGEVSSLYASGSGLAYPFSGGGGGGGTSKFLSSLGVG